MSSDINVKMQRKGNKDSIQTVCFCLINKYIQLKEPSVCFQAKIQGGHTVS